MLKKMRSLFLEEVEQADQETSGSANEISKDTKSPILLVIGEKFEDRFMSVLFEAMERKNLDGFDYLEFKHFLRSLSDMEMDDETRFRSAYASARTLGAESKRLVDSARHYLQVLDEEKQKFEKALNKRLKLDVETKQETMLGLEQEIEEKQSAIKNLESAIEQKKKELSILEQQMVTAESKIRGTNREFIRAHSLLFEQIHSDLEKIQTFLA